MSYVCFDWEKRSKKCAVIGCSSMGACIAYTLAQSGLFDALVLIDEDTRLAGGQAADLGCVAPKDARLDIWAGDYTDLAGCSLIVLACGLCPVHETAARELPALNLPLVRRAAAHIAAHAGDAVILVATQPVDLMTYILLHYSGLSPDRVLGLGTLADTLHLQRLLGRYLSVSPSFVDAMILGQAGEYATAIWSGLRICGMDVDSWRTLLGRSTDSLILHSLFDDVLCAASRCTDAKGHADFATAHAALTVAQAVMRDLNALLPLCTLSDGRFGVKDVCMSLPCVLGRGGVIARPEPPLAPTEQAALEKSAARLRAAIYEAEQSLYAT